MALANYTDLKAAVASWMNRTDLTSAIPDFIALAEGRIARDMRLRSQVTETTLSTVAGTQTVALPDGIVEIENISVVANPLDHRQFAQLGKVLQPRGLRLSALQHGRMRPCVRPAKPFAGFLIPADYSKPQQVIQPAAVYPYVHHFAAV